MIRYSLSCPEDHRFDSWFADAAAFEALQRSGHLSCPVCGATTVEKALMAPSVRPARKAAPPVPPPSDPARGDLSQPGSQIEEKLAALRRHVEANSDYVGMNFAAEARKMHEGDVPERAIYGEAKPEEARALIEDGIPVAPLPFRPTRKQN